MLRIIHYSYTPNTASTNRLIAYVKNIPTNVQCKVYFMMPDSSLSRTDNFSSNIKVVYCWDKFNCTNKLFRFISFKLILKWIKSQIIEGDVVYCYNAPLFISVLYKRGVHYYAEKTEHPLVTFPDSRLIKFNLEDHLKLCRNLDGLFVISTALKDYYINEGVNPDRISIINMTVDASRFINIKKQYLNTSYIAYCGNASNNKDGVDKLIKSFSYVHRTHPNLFLYIIGQAPYSIHGENIQLAKKLCVLDKIVFTGIVCASEMPQLLKNAEVLVLNRPDSLQAQCGFATKIGEYLLTENPIVVTSVGDVPLFLKDGESAMLSSANDDEEFAKKICWLLDNPEDARKIGYVGAQVAYSCFNAEIETHKMLKCMGYEI